VVGKIQNAKRAIKEAKTRTERIRREVLEVVRLPQMMSRGSGAYIEWNRLGRWKEWKMEIEGRLT
jgi:hypothetical protein